MLPVSYKSARGFTLIEVLVATVIIGILAAMSLPLYRDYQIRTNRSAAKAYLLELSNRQEQYLLQNRSYATYAELGFLLPEDVKRYYTDPPTVTVVPPDPAAVPPVLFHGFVATLVPKPGTLQADDGRLLINNLGLRTWKVAPDTQSW